MDWFGPYYPPAVKFHDHDQSDKKLVIHFYHTTGVVLVQGSRKRREQWKRDVFSEIQKRLDKEENTVGAQGVDVPETDLTTGELENIEKKFGVMKIGEIKQETNDEKLNPANTPAVDKKWHNKTVCGIDRDIYIYIYIYIHIYA